MKPFTRKISQPMRAGVFNFMKVVAIVIQFFHKAFQVFYKERFFLQPLILGYIKLTTMKMFIIPFKTGLH